jgi:auxin efflux carrier family protein
MTLTASQPFTSQDQALGVAYISIIMVWCFLTMFPFGGWLLIKRDFDFPLQTQDIETGDHTSMSVWLSRIKTFTQMHICLRKTDKSSEMESGDRVVEVDGDDFRPRLQIEKPASSICEDSQLSNSSSSLPEIDVNVHPLNHLSRVREETELQDLSLAAIPSLSRDRPLTTPTPSDPFYKRVLKSILKFLLSLISPPSITCLLSLIIALVPQLKALFVSGVPGVNIPNAPDGLPPMEWMLDIADFGGPSLL